MPLLSAGHFASISDAAAFALLLQPRLLCFWQLKKI